MSTQLKPIKIYAKWGPNPAKVATLLKELGVPHEAEDIRIADVKKESYTAINPNGRVPSIYDPNTDLTLWESGAIIEYLIERYDPENRVSFKPGTNEYYHAKQWLFFQASGQGPYYGQATWFSTYHSERLQSAIDRYVNEVNRVAGVINGHLEKQKKEHGDKGDGPWLVGGKMSYADIAFVSWQYYITYHVPKIKYNEAKYPYFAEWLNKMRNVESIKTVNDAYLKESYPL